MCEFVQKNNFNGVVGWLVGWMVGESRNKANSVKLELELK